MSQQKKRATAVPFDPEPRPTSLKFGPHSLHGFVAHYRCKYWMSFQLCCTFFNSSPLQNTTMHNLMPPQLLLHAPNDRTADSCLLSNGMITPPLGVLLRVDRMGAPYPFLQSGSGQFFSPRGEISGTGTRFCAQPMRSRRSCPRNFQPKVCCTNDLPLSAAPTLWRRNQIEILASGDVVAQASHSFHLGTEFDFRPLIR